MIRPVHIFISGNYQDWNNFTFSRWRCANVESFSKSKISELSSTISNGQGLVSIINRCHLLTPVITSIDDHSKIVTNISILPTVGDQCRCRVQSVFVNNCTRETFWKETLPPQLVPQLQSMFQKLEELRDLHRLKIKQEEEAKCERLFSKIEHVRNRFNRAYDRICRS